MKDTVKINTPGVSQSGSAPGAIKGIQGGAVKLEGAELADHWRTKLVEEAKLWVGKIPYKFGGEAPQILDMNNKPKNMDCSSFVCSLYMTLFGENIGRTTRDQIKKGIEVKREELKIGDLVFFDWPKDGNNNEY